ncbi:universal stress protein [Kushneria indalinina]|uniref:Nucleotide-binding universal stress UspA family protein n=1 Tax=Kushneria indalinina DSM 14324 TaxID=1122140 RepID=A0A3D9DTW6_9GAMM|nr:universal stress protein [Kushneria indalinina]REC94172.1 nucleotide-binding universal stress UspA family protein [Kushneria indalinina DSM 14324]
MSRTIIACFDDQARADSAIGDYAAWAARQLGAPLCLLHVLEQKTLTHEDYSGQIGLGTRERMLEERTEEEGRVARQAREEGRRMLEALKARLTDDTLTPQLQQRHGALAPTLREQCTNEDLLVLGRCGHQHNHGEGSTSLGAHLEDLAQHLDVPMLIAPERFQVPARAMVALDGSERGLEQLSRLVQWGWLEGLETHVVHVSEPADTGPAERGAELLNAAGLNARAVTLEGDAGRKLPAYAREQEVDLVAMGAYGHSSLRRFLMGSKTHTLLEAMPGAVLLMRHI